MDIQELKNQIDLLKKELEALTAEVHRNNFTARQDFTKYSNFTSMLKVPNYSSLPSTCEVGEVVESGGKLRICSATDTWTVVGAQTA